MSGKSFYTNLESWVLGPENDEISVFYWNFNIFSLGPKINIKNFSELFNISISESKIPRLQEKVPGNLGLLDATIEILNF